MADDPSYPPIYRHPSSPDRHPPASPGGGEGDVPVVDLRELDPGRLGAACRDWGVFRVANHGIPPELERRLMDEARRILTLPFEVKQGELSQPPVSYFWGSPVAVHAVKGPHWFDAVQVLLGRRGDDGGESGGGGWSSFRCLVDEYGSHMARIARTIFDALAIDLKLDCASSASYLRESDGTFRAYRYLCCPNIRSHVGFNAHTDSSTLSILNPNEVEGLQVLHDNKWFDVIPIPDTLIVNLGDMMQAVSNDEYKSVEHRVLVSSGKLRMSLCYFAFPSDEGVIVNSKYKTFTYKDFKTKVQEDIQSFGHKVGLEWFKMNDSKC